MKIIFDSKEQADVFIDFLTDSMACPSDKSVLKLHDHPLCREGRITCKECWENSGIEIEIKENGDEKETIDIAM